MQPNGSAADMYDRGNERPSYVRCVVEAVLPVCIFMAAMAVAAAGTSINAVMSPQEAGSRTRAMLERSCVACHQASRMRADQSPAAGIGNIASLDDLARDPSLVDPGRPDASRLYHVLLSRHRPLDIWKGTDASLMPSPAEIEAVRDWIETLNVPAAGCPERPRVGEKELKELMEDWRRQFPSSAASARFISLAHLANACFSDKELASLRGEVASALRALASTAEPVVVETVGDMSVLLAVRLAESGITARGWREISERAPRSLAGAIPGDWLAHDANASRATGLARRYRVDVGLNRAAAEMGVAEAALAERLEAVKGEYARTARQLRQWQISRTQWEELYSHLEGLPAPARVVNVSQPLKLGLWSDRPAYKTGDLVRLTAMSTGNCYLTVIGIDRGGYATVFFPNDFEQDNFLRGGSPISLPTGTASYQLRTKEAGTETVAAICSSTRRQPEGISHDFEGQRFTVLGSWRAYLRAAPSREAQIEQAGQAKRRNRSKPDAQAKQNPGIETEARAAIYFKVE